MSQPHEEIQSFLRSNGTDPKRCIEVSLQFARAMCEELTAALSQWEEAVQTLELMKADVVGSSN